jgi:hypothetical protein
LHSTLDSIRTDGPQTSCRPPTRRKGRDECQGTPENPYLNESIVFFSLPSEFLAAKRVEEREHLPDGERDNRVS